MQSALSLRHVDRVISAFTPGSSLANVMQGFCYVTSISSIPGARQAWRNAWLTKVSGESGCFDFVQTYVVKSIWYRLTYYGR